MKTSREILFARHLAAVPKLDAIRREVVTGLNRQDAKTPSFVSVLAAWCLGGSKQLWQELIFPCRRIWTGLATVWILLAVVNFSQRDSSPVRMVKSSPPAAMTMTFRDQQKMLNELFADRSLPAEAVPPRVFSPKPRTETMRFEIV